MKRIRIAAGLMISAALLTVSIGVQAASNGESDQVALVPSTVCEELVEILETYDIQDHGGDAVLNFEMIGPLHVFDPRAPWLHLEPPEVSLFRCDRPDPGAISSDIATAN